MHKMLLYILLSVSQREQMLCKVPGMKIRATLLPYTCTCMHTVNTQVHVPAQNLEPSSMFDVSRNGLYKYRSISKGNSHSHTRQARHSAFTSSWLLSVEQLPLLPHLSVPLTSW